MNIDYSKESPSAKLKRFINNKEHHELSHTELLKIYHVNGTTMSHTFFKAIGRKTRVELDRERLDSVLADPLFGRMGEYAPCSLSEIAGRTGTCKATVKRLRDRYGVLPYLRLTSNRGYEGSPPLTEKEEEIYALCAKTQSWGRPKGMTEHLEEMQSR